MATPPAVPPVPASDRYYTTNFVVATSLLGVPFPVYGGGGDLTVKVGGDTLASNLWGFYSASGQTAEPITDGMLYFSPAISGQVEVIGNWQPRQTSMATAAGIGRREFNVVVGKFASAFREVARVLRMGSSQPLGYDAAGPISTRSTYDGEAAGFRFAQTDDSAGRPILYIKISATSGDWSQALNFRGVNGTNGSVWYTGSGAPGSSTGVNGDFYLRTSNGDVYTKSGGSWSVSGNIRGPAGADGDYLATDTIETSIASADYLVFQKTSGGPLGRRILRDNLLSVLPPNRRVSALWTGDETGQVSLLGGRAIMADGTVRAWGAGTDGGNGDGGNGARWLPQHMPVGSASGMAAIVQYAVCGTSQYLLDANGVVWVMGGNACGQLGVGSTSTAGAFQKITYFTTNSIVISKIITPKSVDAAASAHATVFFLTTTGALYACGDNVAGEIGDGTTTRRTTPVQCGSLTNLTQVVVGGCRSAAGGMTVYAVDTSNQLWAWGANDYKQVGNGATTNQTSPYLSASNVAYVDCAGSWTVSSAGGSAIHITTTGGVKVIGLNASGQLGTGNTTNVNSWTTVGTYTNAAKVFMGGSYYGSTVLLLTTGAIRTWGRNANGQLGIGSTTDATSPQTPSGAFQNKVVSAHVMGFGGDDISILLLCSDGTMYGSGVNSDGRLGLRNGSTSVTTFQPIYSPGAVDGATITAARMFGSGYAGGGGCLAALDSKGRMWVSGASDNGALGSQPGNLHSVDGLEKVLFA